MCQSKKQGGKRCVGCYTKMVAAKERQLDNANLKVKEQIAYVVNLEKETKEEIKTLRVVARKSTLKRERERASDKIDRLEAKLSKEKVEIRNLKGKAGVIAEELETRYQNLEILKGETNEFISMTLGNAIVVEKYPEDSEEWHAQRARGYGGSDTGAILRLKGAKTSWNSVFELKTGLKQQRTGSAGAAEVGHQFEPIVRRQFAAKHPEIEVMTSKASWTNRKRDYQLANVDGLVCTDGTGKPNGILEIKTSSHPEDWVDENGDDKLPEYYRTQVLWYMSVFGFKKGYLAVLIDNTEYKEFKIEARPGEIGNIHKKVQDFRDRVATYNKTTVAA